MTTVKHYCLGKPIFGGGWGRKIFSWKDIFQIDDEDDTNNRFNNLPRNATIRKKCVRCGKKDCEAASLITEQPKS